MMHKYKGILFDLDGTLLDTADDLGAALNHVLHSKGLPHVNREHYRPIASDGATGLLNLGFGEKMAQYDADELRAQFLQYYENNIAVHTQLYAGVAQLLTYLDEHEIPWGIVTNKPIGLTKTLLPHFPELKNSKINIGGDSLSTRKPHPEPLLHSCKHLNIQPSDCIYLGDAPRDIEAGNAAGMYSVIALWGYIIDSQACNTWQADLQCTKPEQLLSLL